MDGAEFDQILLAAKDGWRTAVAALYRHFNPMLVHFLRARVPGMGEDLAQEAWLDVGPKLPEFQGDQRAFGTWLLSIARAKAAELSGLESRLRIETMEPQRLATVSQHREPDDTEVADAGTAQLLAGLSPSHVEILLLRFVGHLSAEETGVLVGKSPGAVRVIQHRAVHKLARRLPG